MPKPASSVSLPFFKDGKPFQPKATLDEVKAYEDSERQVLQQDVIRPSSLAEAKATLIQAVLRRELPEGERLDVSMDVRQIHDAFSAIWAFIFRVPGETDPLG
jgi:hypothetical protein